MADRHGILSVGALLLGSLALSACTVDPQSPSIDNPIQKVANAANECTAGILAQVKRLGGRYQLLTRYYIKNQTIEMNGGRVVDTQVRELPAINATSLDNGNPGSAWRDCMKGKNALAPEIVMSQS
ncbi:hypothetical protein [Dickeya zeae]|jgi:hypothetical protein|uniref:hypothetical protein n=1 Tax=Dickeya zeae TaxID=204042 RepID=UPI001F1B8E98|nr:hypothetical protein [Dickeya zeae]UJR61977.1 hypothetical protein HJ586_07015 [Dickeya zeae]